MNYMLIEMTLLHYFITSLLEEQFISSFNEQVSNAKIREICFLNKEQYSALKVKFHKRS
jgi:hypothetical protein